MMHLYHIIAAVLGFGLGFNVANVLYWFLLRRINRTYKAELGRVLVDHARIERDLHTIAAEVRGVPLPPELRQ
jgi:hypothetical protein